MSNDESEDQKYIENNAESEDEKEQNSNEEDNDYKSGEDEDYNLSEEKKPRKKKLIGNKRKREIKKKKTKKVKNAKSFFFDQEAEENEEEESYGVGEITKEQQEKEFKKYDERHFMQKNQQIKITEENEEEIAKRYDEKVNEPEEDEYYDNMDKKPTSNDPKLWLLKCRIGDEKDIMANLYHKYFYFKSKDIKDRLKIFSIITFDNLKGKIFIEAFNERDIIYAIQGMTNTYQNSIQVIPINERMQIFEYDKFEKVDINNNQLVRIKQGNYEGDLAKVVYIQDPVNKIYIALIPRIYDNNKSKNNSFNVAPFSKLRANNRPRQKLFDRKKNYGVDVINIHETYGDCLKFGKFKFRDGLLIKPVRISSLETENINPKEEELQKLGCYKDENGIYRDKNDEQELIISKNNLIKYKKGDKIKFTTGDYKGITGTVIAQNGNKVTAKLDLKDTPGEYEFPVNMVSRDYNFKPGEIVYVRNGNNKGKNGIIIKIMDDNNVTIYDEITQTKFIAKNSDLILSNNMTFDDEENSMFKIGDLVHIKNSNIICYIIDSNKFILKVVTTRNEIKKISVREAEKINVNKQITNIDGKGNPIVPNNGVKIINGQYKGVKATIKYIYKKYVFLHNNNFVRTNGIFCEMNENVELLGSEMLIQNSDKIKVNYRIIPKDIKKLIGKTLNVIKGIWKGYNGIVVAANDKCVKLELSAKQKTIQLPFDYISNGEDDIEKDNNGLDLAPNLSIKTPAYYLNEHHY